MLSTSTIIIIVTILLAFGIVPGTISAWREHKNPTDWRDEV